MKVIVGCILGGLLLGGAQAQVTDANAPAPAPLATRAKTKPTVEVNGPLVSPLKSKKVSEVPKRAFQSINPFAPTQTKPVERLPKTSPRAWSEIVGWGGGQSAFPSEVTHEPRMTLVTVSKPERK